MATNSRIDQLGYNPACILEYHTREWVNCNMQESHKNNTESKGPDTKEYMPYDFIQKVENGQK